MGKARCFLRQLVDTAILPKAIVKFVMAAHKLREGPKVSGGVRVRPPKKVQYRASAAGRRIQWIGAKPIASHRLQLSEIHAQHDVDASEDEKASVASHFVCAWTTYASFDEILQCAQELRRIHAKFVQD